MPPALEHRGIQLEAMSGEHLRGAGGGLDKPVAGAERDGGKSWTLENGAQPTDGPADDFLDSQPWQIAKVVFGIIQVPGSVTMAGMIPLRMQVQGNLVSLLMKLPELPLDIVDR